MTAPKSSNRGVRRGSGGAIKRLGREEIDDLGLCFSGQQASAWVLLLPGYEGCGAEVRRHWETWLAENPNAKMPADVARFLNEVRS